ncbi:MAG TPA: hypothetical protein PKK59_08010 [Anaerolineaceae bacterium]|nr:hypothetical protein [Anaerolineaceae bacterium]
MNIKIPWSQAIILFFVIILFVPMYWVTRGKTGSVNSLIENRALATFPAFPLVDLKMGAKRVIQGKLLLAWQRAGEQFIPGTYQQYFEYGVSDQFPLRATWIQLMYGLERIMIRVIYSTQPDIAIPADMGRSGLYELLGKHFLFYPPRQVAQKQEYIDNTILRYSELLDKYPDMNFYAYQVDGLDYSNANPLTSKIYWGEANRSFEYFLQNKPEALITSRLHYRNLEEYLDYFFRTDHHWNIHGTLQGYEDIYAMLAANYPEISPMISHDRFYVFPDIEFHGSLARFSLYRIRPGDIFEVALLDLPPHKIFDSTGMELDLHHQADYLDGHYSTEPFTDHYVEYYGADRDLIEYVYENGSERNLMIIGDSYANAIESILAAHYHHTYSIDVRKYPYGKFNLAEFLEEHDVDDILFIGGPDQTIRQSWMLIP